MEEMENKRNQTTETGRYDLPDGNFHTNTIDRWAETVIMEKVMVITHVLLCEQVHYPVY